MLYPIGMQRVEELRGWIRPPHPWVYIQGVRLQIKRESRGVKLVRIDRLGMDNRGLLVSADASKCHT